jgi:Raf kinase inhibitor-like YbhB/YbcL family protein
MKSLAAIVPFVLLACASSGGRTDAGSEGSDQPADAALPPPPDAGAGPDRSTASNDAITKPDCCATLPDTGPDQAPEAGAADASTGLDGGGALVLSSTGFLMRGGDLIFPASASYPMDQSPPFEWSGGPAARSFALTFVDVNAGATKWVLWDIPAGLNRLPANISKAVNPPEVPGSSQRGSLGRTGYSGPGVPGPPLHVYQFVLWALDVPKLQGTDGLSTADLRTKLLPSHALAMSAPFVAKGQEGGP